jgi:hypothetical protein
MKKSTHLLWFVALLCASSCGNSVPPPTADPTTKAHHCEKISQDQELGCKACAGFAFCGWKQKEPTDPTTGTCEYVEDVRSLPDGVIGDPTHCPQPK